MAGKPLWYARRQTLARLRRRPNEQDALSRSMLQNDLAIWRLLLMIAFEGYHSFATRYDTGAYSAS